jgi:hypothetical protein
VSSNRIPISVPGQSSWDLRWTVLHWDKFFAEQFCFPLPVSCHSCFILTFIMLLLPEGQRGNLGTFQISWISGSIRQKITFTFFFSLCFKESMKVKTVYPVHNPTESVILFNKIASGALRGVLHRLQGVFFFFQNIVRFHVVLVDINLVTQIRKVLS